MPSRAALAALCAGLSAAQPPPPAAFLSAASPLVLWGGRSAAAADGSVAFDWEGTTASFTVAGQFATLTMHTNVTLAENNSARVSVFINDYDAANLMLHRDTPSYLLAAALPEAVNNVTVHYAFEPGSSGAARSALRTPAIFGFSAGNGGAFIAPAPAARRIDIIGDSITAGSMYDKLESVNGPLSFGTGCHPWSPVTGYSQVYNWETYLCRYFRANCTTVAWSGGVLVDPAVSHCPPRAYMPQLYTQTFGTSLANEEPWDFSRTSRPDLVIIFLGTNVRAWRRRARPARCSSFFFLTLTPCAPRRSLAPRCRILPAAT